MKDNQLKMTKEDIIGIKRATEKAMENGCITVLGGKKALENQKAVYLIVDTKTGKKYVGSAYGDNMLLGRWRNYIANGHGGNKLLKPLDFEYIKENFKYSILEIFKSSVDDETIINRESFWKEVLLTRTDFGYNGN